MAASLLLCLAGLTSAHAAADAERGKTLYETRCGACHATSVHNRSVRSARSFDALRVQVLRWSAEAGGSWTAEEIDDVALYLNQRYYRFPCPPGKCKDHQAAVAR